MEKDHERTELEDTFQDCLFGIVFVACLPTFFLISGNKDLGRYLRKKTTLLLTASNWSRSRPCAPFTEIERELTEVSWTAISSG